MGFVSMEKKLIFISFFFLFVCGLYPQKMYNENKSKLEAIRMELEKKNLEIEEYNEKYEKLIMEVKKLRSNEKNITEKKKKINLLIEQLKKDISETKEKYEALKNNYAKLQNEINNDVTSLYLSRFSNSYFYGTSQLVSDMVKRNMIIQKSNYAKAINYKTKIFSDNITKLFQNKEKYSKDIITVNQTLESNKKEIKKNEKELYLTDARLKKLKSEIDELNRTAKELSSLIKKIEKSSPYKKEVSSSVSLPKKSLPWPAEGVVVKRFGKEYVEDLKTWIINDGIKIKASSLEVKPVMAGKVVYSGEFRGFGNVVILDHGDNIYSTYGFLSQISVSNGSVVDLNTVIGTAGTDIRDDNLNGNILYFEIRKGETALNPTDYLR